MPFGDGTGPRGMGPMTGRGAGYCAGFGQPGIANPILGRRQFSPGFGWRRPYGYPNAVWACGRSRGGAGAGWHLTGNILKKISRG